MKGAVFRNDSYEQFYKFSDCWSSQDKDSDGEVVFLHQSARESGDDVALKIRADFGLPESEDSDSSFVTLPEALQQQHQQQLPAALKEKDTAYSGKFVQS